VKEFTHVTLRLKSLTENIDATTHVDEETKRSQDDTYATAGAQADGGSAEGRAKDLTCNEAEVDALLSSGEST